MIYTVTFNPALDYTIHVENVKLGMTNRTTFAQLLIGGKGLNVSTVLNNLGVDNIALGFIAGFIGKEIQERFEALGGKCDFIELKEGISRINVKIKSLQETEINAAGPVIDKEAVQKFLNKMHLLKKGDILVLAGSIPPSLPDSLYRDIMKMLADKNIMIVVDATKDLLVNVLSYKPFLIKPNNQELGELFNVTIQTQEEVIVYAKKLQEKGARNVLVSMAGDGAVLITQDGGVLIGKAPKGLVRNSVGAGDSMVAGFLAGWCEKQDYVHAFKMGIAAGSASAFSDMLATKAEVEKLYSILT